MSNSTKLHGIYALTDERLLSDTTLLPAVERALDAGVRLVQYRNKNGDERKRKQQASELLRLCRAHGTPLIINDDVELCAAIGADGVHLGQQDAALSAARLILGDQAIIGATCHQSLELARTAQASGADYVAFGRFFPSGTKPDAPAAKLSILRQARDLLDIPVVAIGGINAENGGSLIESGADMLAVVGGIFGTDDIARNVDALIELFSTHSPRDRKHYET